MTAEPLAKNKVENSLSIRLISLLLSLLGISLACHYVAMPRLLALTYIFICLFGSFCAFYFRKKENRWITALAILGAFLVMGNFAQEVFFQFYVGKLNPIGPFISVLAGLLALHTLDLRTRLDINTAALIGLGLMACIGMLARDITFGVSILIYLVLAALLLYSQCISSSLAGVSKQGRDQAALTRTGMQHTLASNILAITSLPIFAILFFLNLPRIDSMIDRLVVELTAHGFPFRVMIVGASDLFAANGGSGIVGGANSEPDAASTTGAGSSDHEQANGRPKTRSPFKIQLESAREGNGHSGGNGYNLGNLGGGFQSPNPRTTTESETIEYTHSDPTNQEEMMLLYADKRAGAANNTVLFTVAAPREVFLKRLVFDTFDGSIWKSSHDRLLLTVDLSPDSLVDLSTIPTFARPIAGSVDVLQEISAQTDLGHVIPAANTPQRIQFPAEQIFVDKYGSLRTAIHIGPGLKYQVVSKTPIFNPQHLELNTPTKAEEQQARIVLKDDLQVPANLGIEVRYLARAIVGSEKNWFSQAERICDYLRHHFEYSLTVPDSQPTDNLVKHFLLVSKKGDCTYFASAFVMLCRSLGIPSRCIGGFGPGTKNIVSGLTEVRWRDSHAWAEVFIPRFGWVPFDAVPGGYLPAERPSKNILASLSETQLAKSLAKVVDSVAKAKGLSRPDDELGSEATNPENHSSPNSGGAQADQWSKGGTSQPSLPALRPGQLLQETITKPLLRIDGIAAGRSQQRQIGWFSHLFSLLDRLAHLDLSWLTGSWRPAAALTILTALIVMVWQLFRQKFNFLEDKLNPSRKAASKYSTLAYMRVMKDLGRLNVKRERGDTAKEVVLKVEQRLSEIDRPGWEEVLPGLLTSFMDLYRLSRFAEDESVVIESKLRDMEREIHLILTST